MHETADGRRFLLIHGDQFDQVTRHHRWVAVLGDQAYNLLVRINHWLSWVRRRLGVSGYWSLAGYAKRKVKTALNFIFDFEESAVHHARERGLDGVICGHIHWATMRDIDGLTYINCGDWVDSCTAIVEHFDGRLELVAWGVRSHVARAGGCGGRTCGGLNAGSDGVRCVFPAGQWRVDLDRDLPAHACRAWRRGSSGRAALRATKPTNPASSAFAGGRCRAIRRTGWSAGVPCIAKYWPRRAIAT